MKRIVHDVDRLVKGGPYSHVVEAGEFLFLSGMLPIDVERDVRVTDDAGAATRVVLNNVKRALEGTGSDLGRVVKATVFLRDMADFAAMNEVYKTYFPKEPPARSCIAVREIPGNYPVEIEVIALK
jgi:2-iminobutanoate/2-iminopropanoate deaminase